MLKPEEQKILAATDADCKCPEDVQQMKAWYGGYLKPVPDYHPNDRQ